MKQTGQILREYREKAGLSIHEVSLALKINSRIIKAMEEGSSAQLPPRTFLRGFVQSYANYLKIDMNQLMDVFQAEQNIPSSENAPITGSTENAAEAGGATVLRSLLPRIRSPQLLAGLVGGGALAVVLAIVLVSRTIEKYQREISAAQTEAASTGAASSPAPTVAPVAPVEPSPTPPVAAESKMTKPLEPKPTPEDVAKANGAHPSAPPARAMPISSVPTKPAEAKPAETKIVESKSTETKPAEIKPAATATSSGQEIILEALDNVTVQVQIDGGATQTLRLDSDQIRTLKAKKALKLSVSDGGAVNIIHNGKDLGVPGALGKPLSLVYPK